MAVLEVESAAVEPEVDEAGEYFFRRVGEICFTPEGALGGGGARGNAFAPLGSARRLALAPKHGVVAFADPKGRPSLPAPHRPNHIPRCYDQWWAVSRRVRRSYKGPSRCS